MANNHGSLHSVDADLTANLQGMPKSLFSLGLIMPFIWHCITTSFCLASVLCVLLTFSQSLFHFSSGNSSVLFCNISGCNFSPLFIHMPPFPPSLLTEVCQPGKHVMMRPDPLALSLLAAHQAALLPQSATNPSDYITLSREALLQASVYACVCGSVWLGGKEGLPLAPVCFVNRSRSQWYFQPVPLPKWTTSSRSAGLCVAVEAIIVTV